MVGEKIVYKHVYVYIHNYNRKGNTIAQTMPENIVLSGEDFWKYSKWGRWDYNRDYLQNISVELYNLYDIIYVKFIWTCYIWEIDACCSGRKHQKIHKSYFG